MKLSKDYSAIVLIEFQKQWTEEGLYKFMIQRQLNQTQAVYNTLNFVNKARELGIKIIHAPLIIDPKNKKGILANISFGQVFTKNTWKSEYVDGIYKNGDLQVQGRYAFDAFIGSDLEQILKDNEITNVILCGFVTDQCVKKTLKTALSKNISAFLVSNCTATFSGLLQKRTEKKYQSRTYSYEEILNSFIT